MKEPKKECSKIEEQHTNEPINKQTKDFISREKEIKRIKTYFMAFKDQLKKQRE